MSSAADPKAKLTDAQILASDRIAWPSRCGGVAINCRLEVIEHLFEHLFKVVHRYVLNILRRQTHAGGIHVCDQSLRLPFGQLAL